MTRFLGTQASLPQGELTQVTQQQQGTTRLVTPKRIDFTYNRAGERTSLTRTADLAGTQVVATTTAQYDPAGRLTEWKHIQKKRKGVRTQDSFSGLFYRLEDHKP